MKYKTLHFKNNFKVVLGNRKSQAAEMVLAAGENSGGENTHQGSDQWLFVVEGKGLAIVNKRRIKLKKDMLLLIKHGDKHEICNTAKAPLKTINFYVPPAYSKSGALLPSGRSQ
jgi:mannose-6-phosphate isomerase-like protein (cupin superfamily)